MKFQTKNEKYMLALLGLLVWACNSNNIDIENMRCEYQVAPLGIEDVYKRQDITTSGLYRDPVANNDTLVSDTANFGNLPWREVFTDPQLQSLIEAGLKQNTDLLSAAQNVKAAEARCV